MYPKADIPLIQLSIDGRAGAQTHFEIGRELHFLREQGVLIFGSGNVVHNLARVRWDMEGGYDWAEDFDGYIKENILQKKYENILHPALAGPSAKLAFTTPEHFYPLLYVLGASDETDPVKVFNDSCVMGSLSMTSYLIG